MHTDKNLVTTAWPDGRTLRWDNSRSRELSLTLALTLTLSPRRGDSLDVPEILRTTTLRIQR